MRCLAQSSCCNQFRCQEYTQVRPSLVSFVIAVTIRKKLQLIKISYLSHKAIFVIFTYKWHRLDAATMKEENGALLTKTDIKSAARHLFQARR